VRGVLRQRNSGTAPATVSEDDPHSPLRHIRGKALIWETIPLASPETGQ